MMCNVGPPQCGAFTGAVPVGAALFDPAHDKVFAQSLGGMIWPRGFVGAAAFYTFNATKNPSDPAFVAGVYSLNDKIAARGGLVCPTNCTCDQVSACGAKYLPVAQHSGPTSV